MCSSSTTSTLTNTSISLTLSDLGITPGDDLYTVSISYSDGGPVTTLSPMNATGAGGGGGTNITLSGLSLGSLDLTSYDNVDVRLVGNGHTYTASFNYGQCKTALPLTLVSFTIQANAAAGYNKLIWVTTNESNTSHFLVQRSPDGGSWSNYGLEPSAGNTTSQTTYNFYVPKSNNGINYYYRLRMFDVDGTGTFSSAILSNGSGSGNPSSFCIYTNIEGPTSVCGPALYKVHNADAFVNPLSISAGTGCISTTQAGLVGLLTSSTAGSITVSAASTGCPTTKTVGFCSGASISGAASMCTTASYTVSGLPAGVPFTWTMSPDNLATLSCNNCSPVTLTKIGSGQLTLSATIAGGCSGGTIAVSKTIAVGSPNNLTGTVSTSTGTKTLSTVTFVPVGSVYVSFSWPGVTGITSTQVSGNATGFYGYGNNFSFNIASYGSAQVNITGTGSCGDALMVTRAFAQSGSYGLRASPNPAKSVINVEVTTVADTSLTISSLQSMAKEQAPVATKMYLYNFNTNALVKTWSFQEATLDKYNLSIAGVKAGIYILKMERGSKTTTTKIIVE
ncbi:MAG TPA: T9SS type A sorting domain-containing protein [Chitinophagaceae bacterium]|nr:T9SS type A sorting domain-containing protein [Chitinophagaceae bacterium]